MSEDNTVYCSCNGFEYRGMCKSINLNDLITCKANNARCYHATNKDASIANGEKYHKAVMP